jgi:hypothetical protein
MVTQLEQDNRESEWAEDEEPVTVDNDLDDFFFDEEEPNPGDRRRDPLRKP